MQVDFDGWNSSAIEDLSRLDFRYDRLHSFSHVIRLRSPEKRMLRNSDERNGKKNEKRWWEVERYDEENGIGGFGPNGGIDGIFEFSGKHVLIQVILHWHFHNQLRLLLLSKFSLTAEKMCVRSVLLLLGKRDSTLMLLLLPSVAETRKPLLLNVVVFLNEWINLILFISFSFIPLKYNSNI